MALEQPEFFSDQAIEKAEGWVGEHEVDRVVVLGSGWRLLPYLPLYDTRHVDRVYCWDGVERPHFVQIKTAIGMYETGAYEWRIHMDTFKAYRNFSVVLAGADPESLRMNACWHLDSRLIKRLGRPWTDPKTGKSLHRITASPWSHDRMSRYRHKPEDLWKRFAPAAPGPYQPVLVDRFPEMRVERGAYFEYAVVDAMLSGGSGRLVCYKPAVDIAGRDLLIQLENSWRAVSMQIKGAARLYDGDVVHCWVPRNTFSPRPDFWLGFYYFDRSRPGMFPECWQVPSEEFVRMTAYQRDRASMHFRAHLDPERDKWRAFRLPISEQGEAMRRALMALKW